MPVVTGVVVLVFGGLTLYFHDDTFIKLKPTIVNALFAVVLLGGLLFKQSLLRYVFGDVYKLKPEGWTILTLRWGLFFLFLAVLNEVVWRGADAWIADPTAATNLWVTFKVWATMPITVVFTMLQLPLLTKYAPDAEHPAAPGGEPTICRFRGSPLRRRLTAHAADASLATREGDLGQGSGRVRHAPARENRSRGEARSPAVRQWPSSTRPC